jgi:hypothetical protein
MVPCHIKPYPDSLLFLFAEGLYGDFMAKQSKPRSLLYGIIGVLVIIVGVFGYLYAQELNTYSQSLSSSASDYNILQGKFYTQQTLLNTTQTKLNQIENNLSTPYTEVLFTDHTIDLPAYNITYTYSAYNPGYNSTFGYTPTGTVYTYNYTITEGVFNYTFNAPYLGYIVFNATSTLSNIANNVTCKWEVLGSNRLFWRRFANTTTHLSNLSAGYGSYNYTYVYHYHYIGDAAIFMNSTATPSVLLCPMQSITYQIPVSKGVNHLVIINNNESLSGMTVTFSAKYVGFHTS